VPWFRVDDDPLNVRWWHIAILVGIAILAATLGGRLIIDSVDREELEAATQRALTKNCLEDRAFRRQYRKRAIAEEGLFAVQVDVNEAFIEVVNSLQADNGLSPALVALGRKLDQANVTLNDLRALIDIRPLPRCRGG
jgi:hypothetical protein